MELDFYLSEMSIADLHGGGLTLQRIVGKDLSYIHYFAHVDRFAIELPAADKFINRGIDLTSIWDSAFIRKLIGNSLANWINKRPFIEKINAKNAARLLGNKFKKNQIIKGLVCPQGKASIYALEILKSYRKVKYISWMMDDHLVKYINGQWWYPPKTEQLLCKHLRGAEHVFVISAEMQSFYKNKFGVESTILFGPANSIEKRSEPILNKRDLLKIGYFGSVTSWQLDVLQNVAQSLNGTNVQLHIYSGIDKLPVELCIDNVYFEGRLDPERVLLTMNDFDAVLLPVSFLEKMHNMSAFNIATKMSECLASGVPTMAIGPSYAAMINYLKINDAAIIVESNKEEDIKNAFSRLRNQKRVNEILQNAGNLVISETGVLPMRQRWLSVANVFNNQ